MQAYLLNFLYFHYSFLRIHTAYYNDEGVLITNPLMCAKHYFKTNFIFDVIANLLPIDLFALISEGLFHHTIMWPHLVNNELVQEF